MHFTHCQKLKSTKVIPEDFAEHYSAEQLFAGAQLSAAVAVYSSAGVGSLLVRVHLPSVGFVCSVVVFEHVVECLSVVVQWSHAEVGRLTIYNHSTIQSSYL